MIWAKANRICVFVFRGCFKSQQTVILAYAGILLIIEKIPACLPTRQAFARLQSAGWCTGRQE
jgi:hypothetical protein